MTVVSFIVAFTVRSQLRTIYFFGSAQTVESYYNVLIITVIIWWLYLDIQKAYTETRRLPLSHEFKLVAKTELFGTLTLFALAYVLRIELPPRGTIVLFFVINLGLLCLNRVFFYFLRHYLRIGGGLQRTILIVGSGEKAQRFVKSVTDHAEWSLDLVGFVDFEKARVGKNVMGATVLGTHAELPKILHEHAIDEVVFAVSNRLLGECTDLLALCEQEGVRAVILSDFFSGLVARAETQILYDQPVLIYTTMSHKEWQLLVKRVFDIVFASLLLLALLTNAVVHRCGHQASDRGPIFYKWNVVGLNKEKFLGYKFRTMVINADRLKEKLLEQNEMKGIAFKMSNDPRITNIGRILRKFSLDELPQLWSVLKGDMSVVGPRPPLETELKRFESWHRRKLSVKPGLTCLWQVSGRSTITDFDEWVKLDLAYIDNWSLWLDFKILLKTIPAVLSGRGAH